VTNIIHEKGFLHGQGDSAGLVDHLVVVKHRLVPRDVQEVEYFGQRGPRPQHQLLVVHHQTVPGADFIAVFVHHADGVVPFLQTLPVAVQVETGDRHLKRGNGDNISSSSSSSSSSRDRIAPTNLRRRKVVHDKPKTKNTFYDFFVTVFQIMFAVNTRQKQTKIHLKLIPLNYLSIK